MAKGRANKPRAGDPTGMAFLDLVARIEADHAKEFARQLPATGKKLPKCVEALADVLRRLDDEATCRFGCKGGPHIREGLVASTVSTAFAALRLIKSGYLDQAFALIRSAAEVANLIFLFVVQPSAFSEWASLDDNQRRAKFAPVKVRLAIEAAGAPMPVEASTYKALSGLGVHHEPGSMPQRYNPAQKGTTVPAFQLPGVLAALNELAGVVAIISLTAPRFLMMPREREDALDADARRLLDNIGKIDALELPKVLDETRKGRSGQSPRAH